MPQTLEGTEAENSQQPGTRLAPPTGARPKGRAGPSGLGAQGHLQGPKGAGTPGHDWGGPPGSRHNTGKKKSPSRNKGQNVILLSLLSLGGPRHLQPASSRHLLGIRARTAEESPPGQSQSCVDSLEVPETHWGGNDFEKLAAMNVLAS